MQDYCEAVSRYPASVVERAVERFRMGEVAGQNTSFAPSIAQLRSELRRTGMNETERKTYFATATPRQIESQPNVIALAQKEAKRRAGE